MLSVCGSKPGFVLLFVKIFWAFVWDPRPHPFTNYRVAEWDSRSWVPSFAKSKLKCGPIVRLVANKFGFALCYSCAFSWNMLTNLSRHNLPMKRRLCRRNIGATTCWRRSTRQVSSRHPAFGQLECWGQEKLTLADSLKWNKHGTLQQKHGFWKKTVESNESPNQLIRSGPLLCRETCVLFQHIAVLIFHLAQAVQQRELSTLKEACSPDRFDGCGIKACRTSTNSTERFELDHVYLMYLNGLGGLNNIPILISNLQ